MAGSSSVKSPPHNQVFINFRGELRKAFVSHLLKAMILAGINVYIDEYETRGNDLTALFDRIEESKVAIAIFSSLYTESKWCLNELAKINECAESGKLVVIPVFYKVDKNDVKNLAGDFGDKFWALAKVSRNEKQDKWREALATVPRKFGFALNQTSDESECITKIVGKVREVLKNLETKIPIDNPGAGDEEMAEADTTPNPIALQFEANMAAISLRVQGMADSAPSLFGIKSRVKQIKEMFNSACGRTLKIGVVELPAVESLPHNQVFINFHGKRLENGFVSHLVNALMRDGINVYMDEPEIRGNDLTVLFDRIEESKIVIAIFSNTYTKSKWCLDELVKIKECYDEGKLVVIPIFYMVDTDDVPNQTGEFGEKFWELAKACRCGVLKWKKPLNHVPLKRGYVLSETSKESDYIIKIVGEVMRQLTPISTDLAREGNGNETSSITGLSVQEIIVSLASGFLSIVLRFPWVGLVFFFAYGFARFFH